MWLYFDTTETEIEPNDHQTVLFAKILDFKFAYSVVLLSNKFRCIINILSGGAEKIASYA